ncbi:MAG: hypothetical protein KA807_14830 [Prolixibacteraceae bacterium]|nr:hypothetical protein [Prolixibacteraceae bacterium]
MKRLSVFFLTLMLLASLFQSCEKDTIPPVPVLPPESSFSIDYEDYNNNKSTVLLIENWLYSSMNVGFFSVIASTSMTIPSIAFRESFNHEPTYIGDQTWQWNYEFPAIGSTYYATLNGITLRKQKVKWEMYIDKVGDNGFNDFLWFEGTVVDSTKADWFVYENPAASQLILQLSWNSSPDHKTSELKHTIVTQDDDDINSYIISGQNPDNELDRYFEIYRSNGEKHINIEWSSINKNGRVKSPDYYKDENWHCWNEKLIDDWCD